jgi:hypothetical protein
MHNNELPSKGRELKLNKRAASSKLYYLLHWRRGKKKKKRKKLFISRLGLVAKCKYCTVERRKKWD